MNKDWLYYGIFFSDSTKRTIYDYVSKFLSEYGYFIFDDWKKYCDHMTLVFNHHNDHTESLAQFYEKFLGDTVSLRSTSVGISERAIALGIDYITDNKHSHVTVTIHPNAKPVESNNITNWNPTDGDFYITGTFKKITK